METMKLSEIAGFFGAECESDCEVTDICTDTRNFKKGSVFVAIKGENFDGHSFVKTAQEKGAAASITDHKIDGCRCIVVEDTREAYRELAGYYRKKFNPLLVGVTGSVGKTTTKEMIALVLSEKFNTLKTEGNFNNEIGLPRTLFNLAGQHECAVIEMGMSNMGEIHRLSRTALPSIGVITNIGFSHIENLGSQQGILRAKMEILDGMDGSAPLIVNGDDVSLYPLSYQLGREVITYGILNDDLDYRAENITEYDDKTVFTVKYQGSEEQIVIPCIGHHNIMNALVSFIVGIKAGLTPNEITSALLKYKPDALRQNIVKKGGQTVIIDCYNASPDSMRASLNVLSQIKTDGRRIAVFGDMLELGELSESLHKLVGEFAGGSQADKIFCYGENSAYICMKAAEMSKEVYHTNDKEELVRTLKSYLKDGDVVLFKASRGMKLEEVIDGIYGKEE